MLHDFSLVNYFCRPHQIGGGVCIFLRNKANIQFKIRNDINNLAEERVFEICAIEIVSPINCVLISCYKVPDISNETYFYKKLSHLLDIVCKHNVQIILCGDLNIDLCNHTKRIHLEECIAIANCFVLSREPTRIVTTKVSHSETAIDVIISNNTDVNFVGNLDHGLSDHHAQLLEINCVVVMPEVQDDVLFKVRSFVKTILPALCQKWRK